MDKKTKKLLEERQELINQISIELINIDEGKTKIPIEK